MRHDPWTVGGLLLLVLLSLGVVQLYRAAPQSVAEARDRTVLAARPDAFTPRLARAEAWLREAEAAAPADDSLAVAAYGEAVAEAVRASEAADDEARRALARDVWARAVLGWADRLRVAGTGVGVRPDDEPTLRRALAMVEQVLASDPPPPTRERAAALRQRIERQLRVGPLEWLPLPR